MRRMRKSDSDPVPGLAELPFHILLALGDGPSHGYAIGQRVEEESGGRLDPTTGALYQALRRLTEESLVTPVAGPDDVDPRRKVLRHHQARSPSRGAGSATPGRARPGRAAAWVLSPGGVTCAPTAGSCGFVPRRCAGRYGAAMEETIANRLAAARAAGRWRAAKVWWREIAGLVTLGVTERWGRGARIRPVSPKRLAKAERARQRLLAAPKAGIMDTIAQELRHAARRLIRTPVFTAAAATTLALAIAANAAIFTLVYHVLIKPLPYANSERLVFLDSGIPSRNVPSGVQVMSWQLYHQLADNARTLASIAAFTGSSGTLTGVGTPERLVIMRGTPSLLSVFGATPALGRWFIESEGTPGAPAVAVLTHGFWVRRFGADPSVVGRTILIDGVPTNVVGVMSDSFTFPRPQVDLWQPARSTRASASFLFEVQGVARLRDDATVASARVEITKLIEDLARVAPNQTGIVSMALPLHEFFVGRIANALWILLAAVGLVLIVACANIANLFLVRSESRHREVAVRRALGAGTRRLARYFLTESVLLGAIGGILGLGLAWAGVRMLVAFGPVTLPRLSEVRIDPVVVIFTAGLSLLAAVAFGAIPLLRLAPITAALHDSGRGQTATRGQHRARQVLMTAQVALALVLLVASGLMVRSVQQLRNVDLGFDPTSTLAFGVALPERAYETRERAATAHRAILDRLNALPGVISASASSALPLSGTAFGNGLVVEGELDRSESTAPAVRVVPRRRRWIHRDRGHPPDTRSHDPAERRRSPRAGGGHRRGARRDVLPRAGPDWQASQIRGASESKTAHATVARDCRRRVQYTDRRADRACIAADVHADVDRGRDRTSPPRRWSVPISRG